MAFRTNISKRSEAPESNIIFCVPFAGKRPQHACCIQLHLLLLQQQSHPFRVYRGSCTLCIKWKSPNELDISRYFCSTFYYNIAWALSLSLPLCRSLESTRRNILGKIFCFVSKEKQDRIRFNEGWVIGFVSGFNAFSSNLHTFRELSLQWPCVLITEEWMLPFDSLLF